jgi:hypothetical protein
MPLVEEFELFMALPEGKVEAAANKMFSFENNTIEKLICTYSRVVLRHPSACMFTLTLKLALRSSKCHFDSVPLPPCTCVGVITITRSGHLQHARSLPAAGSLQDFTAVGVRTDHVCNFLTDSHESPSE